MSVGGGFEVYAAEATGLRAETENDVLVRAEKWQLHEEGDANAWYDKLESAVWPDRYFDAVLMRLDPPVDARFRAATMLLETMQPPVFNAPQALLTLNEKLLILRFPQWTPPTLASANMDDIAAFCRVHRGAVIKPLDGMGGQGIYVSPPDDKNLRSLLEILGGGRHCLMAQEYLSAAREGDSRVFVIDGVPMEWMLERRPRDDDHRSNLAAGGNGQARPISEVARRIAEDVGEFLKQSGVLFAGLDIIGGRLTEINMTCPTGLCEVRAQTGEDYAETVLRAVQSAVSP